MRQGLTAPLVGFSLGRAVLLSVFVSAQGIPPVQFRAEAVFAALMVGTARGAEHFPQRPARREAPLAAANEAAASSLAEAGRSLRSAGVLSAENAARLSAIALGIVRRQGQEAEPDTSRTIGERHHPRDHQGRSCRPTFHHSNSGAEYYGFGIRVNQPSLPALIRGGRQTSVRELNSAAVGDCRSPLLVRDYFL